METNKITASVHFIGDNNSNTCSSFQFSKKTLEWSMMSSSLLINYFPHPVYQRGFSNHFPAKWHEEQHQAFSNTIWARIVVTRGAFFFQDHKTVESAISRIQFRSCWFFLVAWLAPLQAKPLPFMWALGKYKCLSIMCYYHFPVMDTFIRPRLQLILT